ncbi:MAG: DUF4258 domain-containing protein [Oceanicaulis sp.]
MMKDLTKELTPGDATKLINAYAAHEGLSLAWTLHGKQRLRERNLIIADVMHVLCTGFVYDPPQPASRGFWKYRIEGTSPNSGGRRVRIVVIPAAGPCLKIVTLMWRDET